MKDESRLLFPPRLPNCLVLGLFFLLFLFMYGSVLVVNYGYMADYMHLEDEPWDTHGAIRLVVEGRPLLALGHVIANYLTEGVDDLRYTRFVGIVGISFLGYSIYRMLVQTGRNAFQSFCAGVIICSSLPIQIFATWTHTAMFPFSAALSAVALHLSNCAFSTSRFGLKCLLVTGSLVALLAAVTIFQPTAMFFWLFAAMILLTPEASIHDTSRRLVQYIIIFSTAMLLGIAVYKTGGILFADLPPRFYRFHAFPDVSDKIGWFLSGPLSSSLHPIVAWNWAGRHEWRIVSGYIFSGCIAAGMFLYFNGPVQTRIYKSSVATAVLMFSFAPILLVPENRNVLRTLAAPSAIVLLFALFAINGFAGTLRFRKYVNIGVACVAIVCAMVASYQTLVYMVVPQARELTIMQSQLADLKATDKGSIHIIVPDYGYGLSPVLWGEFGAPSLRQDYVAEDMARVVIRSMISDFDDQLTITKGKISDPVPPDSLVVDLRNIFETAKEAGW